MCGGGGTFKRENSMPRRYYTQYSTSLQYAYEILPGPAVALDEAVWPQMCINDVGQCTPCAIRDNFHVSLGRLECGVDHTKDPDRILGYSPHMCLKYKIGI